jgi:hypothetical protein
MTPTTRFNIAPVLTTHAVRPNTAATLPGFTCIDSIVRALAELDIVDDVDMAAHDSAAPELYVTTSIDDLAATCATLAEALAPWGGGCITPINHIVALDLGIPAGHPINDDDRQAIAAIVDALEAVPMVHEVTQPVGRTRPYELILTVHHGDLDVIDATLDAALAGYDELPWQ